ncbi:hypothetical protein [Methyloraptor flagellatus]|jgi:hypothetical protein|uniref:Uncharacterized protein n=1 Tax=Methyloraptor flagellatus TaxID=3162530 RepID=A0AAU7XA14_9HYPH
MRGLLQMVGQPMSARSIGLGERFRYWSGASGRRYLFSSMSTAALDDLTNVVVLLVATDMRGEHQVVWLGEIDGEGVRSGQPVGQAKDRPTRAYVHLLAGSDDERRAILLDLTAGRA